MILPSGVYEALLDEDLDSLLQRHVELRSVFGKLDPEEQPARYSAFVSRVLEKALRLEEEPEKRLLLCNEIIGRLMRSTNGELLGNRQLVLTEHPVLLELTPKHYAESGIARPETGFTTSSLFTGSPSDPQLIHELLEELQSADAADILVQCNS